MSYTIQSTKSNYQDVNGKIRSTFFFTTSSINNYMETEKVNIIKKTEEFLEVHKNVITGRIWYYVEVSDIDDAITNEEWLRLTIHKCTYYKVKVVKTQLKVKDGFGNINKRIEILRDRLFSGWIPSVTTLNRWFKNSFSNNYHSVKSDTSGGETYEEHLK